MSVSSNLLKVVPRNIGLHVSFIKKYDCKWFVFATKLKGCNNFKVRKVNLTHKKYYGDYLNRNRFADPYFVKDVVLDKLREVVGSVIPNPRQIKDDFVKTHNTNIPYTCAWKNRNLVLEELFGNCKENYKLVSDIFKMVTKTNEGFVVVLSFGKTEHKYESMTISFDAPIKDFQYGCMAKVGLNTCYLTGKFGGALMAATTLDGQNGLVPLGICVFGSETKENWVSFFRHLKPGLKDHKIPVCFISDIHKGLWEVVPIFFLDTNTSIVEGTCKKSSRNITRDLNYIPFYEMHPNLIRTKILRKIWTK